MCHKRIWMVLVVLCMLAFGVSGCTEDTVPETTGIVQRTTAESELGQYGLSGAKNEEVSFGSPEFTIHGTLSVPDKDKKKYPVVILVGGSGPVDRDETIGANKIFRDISQNLVKAGIAVLRYDKRTLTHVDKLSEEPDYYKKLTIYHEVVDDAIYAVDLLSADDRIDSSKIFVLGHSLGGNLAPEIASIAGDGKIAGIIMMAANVTPIWDLLVDQCKYICELDGEIDDLEKRQIELYIDARNYINSPSFNSQSDYRRALQVYPPYWLSLKNYDAIDTAKKLSTKIKIMIAQGGRDYQVPVSDYEQWKKALEDRAEFFLYDGLNHLFIEGEGPSTPAEYMVEGSVSKDFLDDLINFILSW